MVVVALQVDPWRCWCCADKGIDTTHILQDRVEVEASVCKPKQEGNEAENDDGKGASEDFQRRL